MKPKYGRQHLNKSVKNLTRKQSRKEQRKQKKQRKNEYYSNRKKRGQFASDLDKSISEHHSREISKSERNKTKKEPVQKQPGPLSITRKERTQKQPQPLAETTRKTELKHKKKLENEMKHQRKKQLIEANEMEDIVIKKLEKQLKLNKRKSKSIPKSFAADGLDYLLEVCDAETNKTAVEAEKHFADTNEDFEEDFLLMADKSNNNDAHSNSDQSEADSDGESLEEVAEESVDESSDHTENDVSDNDSEIEMQDINEDEMEIQESISRKRKMPSSNDHDNKKKKSKIQKDGAEEDFSNSSIDYVSDDELEIDPKEKNRESKNKGKKHKISLDNKELKKKQRIQESDESSSEDDRECSESEEMSDEEKDAEENTVSDSEGIWEDIYGRKRRKDGTIIEETKEKYIPPAVRAKNEINESNASEKLIRLRKQLKGLINRLAEKNMHNISSQIEDFYMNNSRFDMNNTITDLMLESLISPVNTPERLIMEHVLLIIILHANVGTEVGAHFLQTIVKNFDTYIKEHHPVENKLLDNTVKVIAQLYNFKLYDSKLLYEILEVLAQQFEEKEVECILHILRGVGFSLRKDNPLALKDLILNLQKRAANVTEESKDNSRVKFMLDILLAIKNNNVTKIPNYDTTYSEHLKKIMRNFIRKGNYVTPLSISLEDLLRADEKGRWWVVGSAWLGNSVEEKSTLKTEKVETFSQKLLELARKQRMNTDTRRNIFCIVMSAEDYLEAFERLLKLGLKNVQEREILNVIIHCALQEKTYNPYYTVLTQKFCDTNRKYQMMVKYLVWDKLKALNEHSASQISNLAKLLTHLFIEKSLSISALKIIQFSELDKVTVRFVRQILLGILLHEDDEAIVAVFEKVGLSDKLKMFRESLQLFICHFLLKNLKQDGISSKQKDLLETRAKLIEKVLLGKREKFAF